MNMADIYGALVDRHQTLVDVAIKEAKNGNMNPYYQAEGFKEAMNLVYSLIMEGVENHDQSDSISER